MSKERFKASTKLTRREGKTLPEGHIPGPASVFLGGQGGDTLVFEEGSFLTAERAAAKGAYLILRKATAAELLAARAASQQEAAPPSPPQSTIIAGELSAEAQNARRLLGGN